MIHLSICDLYRLVSLFHRVSVKCSVVSCRLVSKETVLIAFFVGHVIRQREARRHQFCSTGIGRNEDGIVR